MKKLVHLLRAGLIGGLALVVVGGLIAATESSGPPPAADAVDGNPPSDPATTNEPPRADAPHPRTTMFQFAFVGAIVAVLTTLILFLFPVGPVTKIVYGVILGPVFPVVLYGAAEIQRGNPDNVGGLVMIGMLVGLLVGLLEASRVLSERSAARAGTDGG